MNALQDEAVEESDFSLRKMKVAFAILVGSMFGSSILPMMAISLLLLPMTKEFGWSRTEFSGGMTAMMLAGACVSPILGRLVDRIGVRLMIIGGTAVVALVVMAMSMQNGSLLQFYGLFALLGITGTTAIGYSKVIGALFNKHRGKALAVLGVESSFAMGVAPLIIQYLIDSFGWRGMFVGLGVIIIATVPILLLWLEEPRAPAGVAPAVASSGHVPAAALPGLETREVLRTREFWFIAIASVLATGPAIGLMPHFVPYLTGRGFSIDFTVATLSSMTIAMAVGTVIGGWVVDWSKTARIAAVFSACITAALVLFTLMSADFGGVPLLLAAMALLGIGAGAARPMGTYFQLRFFGLRSFGTIMGIQSPFLAVSMGISPLLVGWCFDRYGTYQPAFVVMAASMGLTILFYLGLPRYRYAKNFAEAPVEIGPLAEVTAPDRPVAVAI